MRRILIPLVFVALLTMAAIVPVAADSGSKTDYPGGCGDYGSSL